MKGIDIIEAFGGIDNDLLLDARRHKPAAPRWLKWVSLAACLCCVTALTVLSLSRLTAAPESRGNSFGAGAPTPGPEAPALPHDSEESAPEPTPTPTPEPTPTPTPEAQPTPTPAPGRDYLELTSDLYQVTLYAPVDYASEITTDTSLVDTTYDVSFPDVAFSFVDTAAQTPAMAGRVWSISVRDRNSYDWDDIQEFLDFNFLYNRVPLGTKGDYVYELVYSSPGEQCDPEDPTAVFSYYCHLTDGLTMLEDFITRNGLEEYPLWRDTYREKTITALEENLTDILLDIDPALRADLVSAVGLTPESPAYTNYGCTAPQLTLYVEEDNPVELKTPSSNFQTNQHIAFSLRANFDETETEKHTVALYVIRNSAGAPILTYISERTWEGSWTAWESTTTLPDMPQTPGAYTLEVYFDGRFFASAGFTVQ